MRRQASAFALPKRRSAVDDDPFSNLDDNQLGRVLGDMAQRFEGLDSDDPKQMAGMMRHLVEHSGVGMGSGLEEAVRRMELGDDPDRIEDDLGDALDDEAPFHNKPQSKPDRQQSADRAVNRQETPSEALSVEAIRKRLWPPAVDDTLYDL